MQYIFSICEGVQVFLENFFFQGAVRNYSCFCLDSFPFQTSWSVFVSIVVRCRVSSTGILR